MGEGRIRSELPSNITTNLNKKQGRMKQRLRVELERKRVAYINKTCTLYRQVKKNQSMIVSSMQSYLLLENRTSKRNQQERRFQLIISTFNPLGRWLSPCPRHQRECWSPRCWWGNLASRSVSQFCYCQWRGNPNRFVQSFRWCLRGTLRRSPRCQLERLVDHSDPIRTQPCPRSESLGHWRFHCTGSLREIFVNWSSEIKLMQILLTNIIEFSVLDREIQQDDGFPKPVPDDWLEPLTFSKLDGHDVARVWTWKIWGHG